MNEIAYMLVGFAYQYRARIVTRLPDGYRRCKPVPVGVPVEVVTWPDGTIDVFVLRARILINGFRNRNQGNGDGKNSD